MKSLEIPVRIWYNNTNRIIRRVRLLSSPSICALKYISVATNEV